MVALDILPCQERPNLSAASELEAKRSDPDAKPRSSDRHRKLAAPLQYDQAACLTRLQATSTRSVRARLRRLAGCATSTGFAGHAGATANLKLHSTWTTQRGLT
jgi:hypothetical protein